MTTVYFCGRLIDCLHDGTQQKRYLTVCNGIIQSISDTCPKKYDELLDWSDYTVMPGLINCHTHVGILPTADNDLVLTYPPAQRTVFILQHLRELLASGVTTIRDLGCYDNFDLQIRDFIRGGEVLGPDMYAAGPMLTMTGGHAHKVGVECDGVDECRKATRERLKSGVDLIKVMSTGGVLTRGVEPGAAQLSKEELTVICEEAHKAGRLVSTHAQGNTGIRNALAAGVDTVEHGFFMDQEIVDTMVKNRTYYVPTFCAPYFMATMGEALGLAQEFIDKVMNSLEAHAKSFEMALRSGVKIACGTDAGTPFNGFDQTAREILLMHEHGMTPQQALRAATVTAAECIGLSDRGVLAEGKRADLIAVEADPLSAPERLLDGVRFVVRAGRCYNTAALKEKLS